MIMINIREGERERVTEDSCNSDLETPIRGIRSSNSNSEMEIANYLVPITAKRKELEVVSDLSPSSLPKKIKLEHANFPQFLEEEEDSPVAILFNSKHELTASIVNQTVPSHSYIDHEMEAMEEDRKEEQTISSLMEVDNNSTCNQHHCMLPQIPQRKSAYLWSGFF